ncbi:KTSC domain-containing protein [Pseudoflavitalea sp. X16]|uniref:KTSC domain-containing protein n=1 Tax=Paraflavitalea devenefica TaxID=2716334 RepID=UPI0014232B5F|nr:KTSC domain-containing protein [Paraflavitalea devenefica]NII24126.1 KTSC domain-containing protein [Paraflavitalea devenefica]
MRRKRLTNRNKIYTPSSETTVSLNYSPVSEVLEVEFTGGKVYHYLKVEPEIWDEFVTLIKSGGSAGIFVNKRIKTYYDDVRLEL